MSSTIHVSNISPETKEKELKDFLSFCGKITSIQIEQDGSDKQKATVVFEKASAASTAKLLDGTSLGKNEIHVTSDSASATTTSSQTEHDDELGSQESKPRTRIFAEYLAHGYKLGDSVLGKAIEYDNTHGISQRFFKGLTDLDKKTGASTTAANLDSKYKVTEKAQQGTQSVWSGFSSYFEKFAGTDTGRKVHAFYTDSEKQVRDIHNEAVRLAGLKDKYSGVYQPETVPGTDGAKTHCGCGGKDAVCGCKAGECTCSGCSKSSGTSEVKKPEVVPGTGGAKTHCGCGGEDAVCGCKAGQCTCSGCSKSESNTGVKKPEPVPGTGGAKTHCGCGGEDAVCGCKAGQCTCSGCPKSSATADSTTATGPGADLAATSNVAPLGEKK